MAEFKTARGIAIARKQEERLGKESKSKGTVKGGFTEDQIYEQIEGMTWSDEDTRLGKMKYIEAMQTQPDTPTGRRNALSAVIKWIDKVEKGEINPNEDDGLKAAHGEGIDAKPVKKYTPAKEVLPPEGFVDTGRTSGGKKVYRSVDGKKAWLQP